MRGGDTQYVDYKSTEGWQRRRQFKIQSEELRQAGDSNQSNGSQRGGSGRRRYPRNRQAFQAVLGQFTEDIKLDLEAEGHAHMTDVLPQNELVDGVERFLGEMEESLSVNDKQIDVLGKEIDFSSKARLMRAYAGSSLKGGFGVNNGVIGLAGKLEARATLASGAMKGTGYWPHDDGWRLRFQVKGNDYDLGGVRVFMELTASGFAGASAYGAVNLAFSPDGERLSFKPNNQVHAEAARREGTEPAKIANAELFAGAKVGGTATGGVEWDNPEERSGDEPAWRTFGTLGAGGELAAGIGAEAQLMVDYIDGRFVFEAEAGLVLGLGAGGEVKCSVNADTVTEFLWLVAHQLKANDYAFLEFIAEEAFQRASELVAYMVLKGYEFTVDSFAEVMGDIKKTWSEFLDGLFADESVIEMAERINKHPEKVKIGTPEAKGRILYVLSQNAPLAWPSSHREKETAIVNVLEHVQTQREFIEVCEHITPDGSSRPKQEGEQRLQSLLNGDQYYQYLQIVDSMERGRGEEVFPERVPQELALYRRRLESTDIAP